MELELKGKTALVTGGSRGIGFAVCETLLTEGARVTLVGSKPETVNAAIETLRKRHAGVRGLCVDLAAPEALADAVRGVDILVNNAGAIPGGGLTDLDETAWRSAWEVKVYGYLRLTSAALDLMMTRGGGVIVNVIGIAGAAPRYDYISGSMANAALMQLTRAAGAYSTRGGVRIVGVNPGPTRTERLVRLYQSRAAQRFGDRDRWPEMLAHLPFGRAAEAAEIADLVAFLASARASYLSGVVIDADGGAMYRDA